MKNDFILHEMKAKKKIAAANDFLIWPGRQIAFYRLQFTAMNFSRAGPNRTRWHLKSLRHLIAVNCFRFSMFRFFLLHSLKCQDREKLELSMKEKRFEWLIEKRFDERKKHKTTSLNRRVFLRLKWALSWTIGWKRRFCWPLTTLKRKPCQPIFLSCKWIWG